MNLILSDKMRIALEETLTSLFKDSSTMLTMFGFTDKEVAEFHIKAMQNVIKELKKSTK